MHTNLRIRTRILLILQLFALLLTLTTISALWANTSYIMVPLFLLTVLGIQILILFRYLDSSSRMLNEFLEAVFYSDFARQFSKDSVDEDLRDYFNEILKRFREFRVQGENQSHYLEALVKRVPVPLISLRTDGSIALINKHFRQLVGVPGLKSVTQLSAANPDFPAQLLALKAGESRLIQTSFYQRPLELRLSCSELRFSDAQDSYGIEKLITIENLSGELHEREASAWTRLIRVLTHEIMNTLTPVTSLAQTASDMVAQLDPKNPDPEEVSDLQSAIATIHKRSSALTHFVERYREYLNIPLPDLCSVPISNLIDQVVTLHSAELAKSDIQTSVEVTPQDLHISADPLLLDKVFINIIKNAIQALEGVPHPKIEITAQHQQGNVIIHFKDNGCGMSAEVRENMFVPFYTTKRDGSGIGLSVARQVMRAHGGEILALSSPQETGTSISLLF